MLQKPLQTSILAAFTLTAGSLTTDITTAERAKAERYLEQTQAGVVKATQNLTDAQWNFKPAPDRWSIAEIVEHMSIVEGFVGGGVLGGLDKAPAPPADRDAKAVDALILSKVPDRSNKVKAPESIVPTGKVQGPAALDNLLHARKQIEAALQTSHDLRGHNVPHPALGPLDGYQWILAASAHTDRHTQQILEVKADPNFPAK